jgi:hypothetical protein
VVFYGQRGELRQRYREGQEDQLHALGLVVNAILIWNTMYMQRALDHLRQTGQPTLKRQPSADVPADGVFAGIVDLALGEVQALGDAADLLLLLT